MEHHTLHTKAAFEGYYNKFDLPSRAQLVVVVSKVRGAKAKANMLSFTYVPQHGTRIWQRELFVDALDMRQLENSRHAFILDIPGVGYARWSEDGSAEYSLEHDDFSFHATAMSPIPWSDSTNTPEGLLVRLPLPLHWHVQSLASHCKFTMKIPGYGFPPEDASGEAILHQEKNWAHAFPSAHMWIQAREGDRGICCAGGQILGAEAYLFGYRSNDLNFDFRPPFALRFLGFGPFLTCKRNWEERTFNLTIHDFQRKVEVHASAPKGSFFSLSPPFAEGHRKNYLGQSLSAKIKVKVYERGWFGPWRLERHDLFNRAGLEFGADYYPAAGTEARVN